MTAASNPDSEDFRIAHLLDALARAAPFEKAAGWDPVGLQIGDPGAPLRRAALCHEVTEAVVRAVEADPVDLLVSYHPLLFRPTTRLVSGADAAGRAWRLARAGVALAVAHTNFDVAQGGAADALAEALELENTRGFAPLFGSDAHKVVTFVPADASDAVLDAMVLAGAGRIGAYTHCSFQLQGTGTFYAGEGTQPRVGRTASLNRESETRLEVIASDARLGAVLEALIAAHPYEEPAWDAYAVRANAGLVGRVGNLAEPITLEDLAGLVEQALAPAVLRVAGEAGREVYGVAVLPGAGGDLLAQAGATGADAVVTGDVGHHRARAALDAGLAVLDPGHAATERPGLQRLFALVAAQGVETRSLLDLEVDPWIRR